MFSGHRAAALPPSRQSAAGSSGAASPAPPAGSGRVPPPPHPPPSNPGLCTARRSPGPAGPRAPRGGVGRAGRRAGWGWGWRKGRTSPHPAERLARGQPRSAAPERCRGPARIGEHLVPRSLPNRYPPRRQTAGGEPGSEPCPRPGGRTHTHRHTQTGEGEQQTRPPQSDGSRQRGFLLAITSPMPPRGACGARRHHPHIPPPPRCFGGSPQHSLGEWAPQGAGGYLVRRRKRGRRCFWSRGGRNHGHPGVHRDADQCTRCGYRGGITVRSSTDRQTDIPNTACLYVPLYLAGCMWKFACSVRMHGCTYTCVKVCL